MKKWKKEHPSAIFSEEGRTEWHLAGKIGNNCNIGNASVITNTYHFNGSGDEAFGGADKWAVVELLVAFESGQEEERNELSQLLRDVVFKWFSEQEKFKKELERRAMDVINHPEKLISEERD